MSDFSFTLVDTVKDLEARPNRWKATARRQMIESINRLPKFINLELEQLPANEQQLAAVIDAKMNWQRDGFNTKRNFTNFRGRVLRAVRETRPASMPRFTRINAYGPEWRVLVDEIRTAIDRGEEAPSTWRPLAHLVGYANWRGVRPEDVDSGVLADLLAMHAEIKRMVRGSGSKPKDYARKAIDAARTWNRLVREKNSKPWLHRLPATILEWEGQRKQVNLKIEDYPASFQEDVEGYFRFLRLESEVRSEAGAGDPRFAEFAHIRDSVSETEQPPLRDVVFKKRKHTPAKPKTIETRQWAIKQAAGALVRLDMAETHEIESLRDITSMPALKAALTDLKERHEAEGKFDEKAASRFQLGCYLVHIAKFARWHDAHIAEMWLTLDSPTIRTESVGRMSANRRELLEQFDEPWAVQAWFDCPAGLFAEAEATRRKTGDITPTMIVDVETAIVCETVKVLPVRRANLGLLRYKGDRRSLVLARHRGERSWLVWERDETKNDRRLRAALSSEAERMIRAYLEHYRPRYLGLHPDAPDSEFLFPGTVCDDLGENHRDLGRLGQNFSKRMADIGLAMTLHLCRHLIAQLVLDADPSQLQLVADLLGDKVETVKKFYIDDRNSKASEKLRELFAERMAAMTHEWRKFEILRAA